MAPGAHGSVLTSGTRSAGLRTAALGSRARRCMAVGRAGAQVAAIYDGLGEPHSGEGYLWQCQGEKMIDHIILTVSDVERSLAFYEASLAPLDIRFFLPYKGENGHPDLW